MTEKNNKNTERLESLKAGAIGAGAIALFWIGLTLFAEPLDSFSLENQGIRAIAIAVSGFLFGVTYRYAVGNTFDIQVELGVIFAFAGVRGLAFFESIILPADDFVNLFVTATGFVLKALGEFAIAGLIVGFSLRQNWIKPIDKT